MNNSLKPCFFCFLGLIPSLSSWIWNWSDAFLCFLLDTCFSGSFTTVAEGVPGNNDKCSSTVFNFNYLWWIFQCGANFVSWLLYLTFLLHSRFAALAFCRISFYLKWAFSVLWVAGLYRYWAFATEVAQLLILKEILKEVSITSYVCFFPSV